jgi:acetyl-CoA/propionyl-CoA carboxylase biotin carboxyl carrier protein
MFRKILIANRGEIAVRIIRACRDLGISSVAVYSDFDRDSLHTRLADEAYYIGDSPATESYLNIDRILQVGRDSGAEALHPGYGFLAESPTFAAAVVDSGMTWIGPSPEAIAAMGDKVSSRKLAESAGFPPVPGTLETIDSPEAIVEFAKGHGWPVAIKASAGGGGKGMRVVHSEEEVEQAFTSAKREAAAYFGNDAVYLERYIERPRHVEVQVLADLQGNAVYVGERDCSCQRKHQKVIEETPCASIGDETRSALGEAALKLVRACGYVSAGTVECLLDENDNFYFLEMNTRIQVEHCVTEEVFGVDLVASQIRIAAGEPLGIAQEDLSPDGHAIECRINAEDPAQGFLPTPGVISSWRMPQGPGIRVDAGYEAGLEVGQFYDNLVAKIIARGRDRAEARSRMLRALEEMSIEGISTNIPLHKAILTHPEFIDAKHYTRFIEEDLDLGALAQKKPVVPGSAEIPAEQRVIVEVGPSRKRFEVKVFLPQQQDGSKPGPARPPRSTGTSYKPKAPAAQSSSARVATSLAPGAVTAPMQGTIVQIAVEEGQEVSAGDSLCILEAMKMENQITADASGKVKEIKCKVGDTVGAGDILVILE